MMAMKRYWLDTRYRFSSGARIGIWSLLAMVMGSLLSLGLDGPAHGIALIGEIPGHLLPHQL